ncbi:MAG TPA: L,D-transpeptidase [Polyangiaceae bacterium]|nr:L,D-transpeptidase [Polyangiaceae bacterium]
MSRRALRRRFVLLFSTFGWGCQSPAPAPSSQKAPAPSASVSASASASAKGLGEASATPPSAKTIHVVQRSIDVVASPAVGSPIVGTVRAGRSVTLALSEASVAPDKDCSEGWFAVVPMGFVCAGSGTTRNVDDTSVKILRDYTLASGAALPATYGLAEMTPVYMRVPLLDEQLRSEPGVESHLHKLAASREGELAARGSDPRNIDIDLRPSGLDLPDELRKGLFAPPLPKPLMPNSPVVGLLYGGSYIAWVAEFDAEGRTWLLTPDLFFVPRDKVNRATISGFHGALVPSGAGVAFIGQRPERRYRLRPGTKDKFVVDNDAWSAGTVVLLAEPALQYSDEKFLETAQPGVFLKADEAIVVHPTPPSRWGIEAGARWIEISAKTNVLLERQGASVVFATLVSVGDNDSRRGKFRVYSKHLSLGTPFERPRAGIKAEVPEVMLVSDTPDAKPYPLFGGWWISTWGMPNATSGVALSPLDARRLFDDTLPALPEGWHSVRGDGTWVVIHD